MNQDRTIETGSITPAVVYNGVSVYSGITNDNQFDYPLFHSSRTRKWGELYNRDMVVGMPSIGGRHKFYVDSRIEGFYLMWIVTKLDQGNVLHSELKSSIMSWTPKQNNDSAFKAGFRLFLVYLKEEGIDHIVYDHHGNRLPVESWGCSENCKRTAAFYLHYDSQFEYDQKDTFSIIDFPL